MSDLMQALQQAEPGDIEQLGARIDAIDVQIAAMHITIAELRNEQAGLRRVQSILAHRFGRKKMPRPQREMKGLMTPAEPVPKVEPPRMPHDSLHEAAARKAAQADALVVESWRARQTGHSGTYQKPPETPGEAPGPAEGGKGEVKPGDATGAGMEALAPAMAAKDGPEVTVEALRDKIVQYLDYLGTPTSRAVLVRETCGDNVKLGMMALDSDWFEGLPGKGGGMRLSKAGKVRARQLAGEA